MIVSKRMLVSLGIIVVTSALAVGGTISYFSDKETSTANTFAAGAVDLTVDSTGHYNGLICVDKKWQNCDLPDTQNNLVVNGSFETPVVTDPAKWQIFNSGTDWTIEWVDPLANTYQNRTRPDPALQEFHRGVLGNAHDGDQYTELDSDWFGPNDPLNGEPALVKISQNITTQIGKKYELSYWFSPRPNTDAGENEMKVYVDNVLVGTNGGAGGASINWTEFKNIFTATGTSTKIEFVGGGPNDSLGIFLDDVRVYGMTCVPSTEFTQECNSSWTLTDLGPTNKFFDFADIKPGDYGENTISLHVNSNDAYACMTFNNLTDDENGINDPESKANDTDGVGELSRNIQVFAWKDDGNNIWESNETQLWEGGPIYAKDLKDKIIPLATPQSAPIVSGDTKYLGFAWCAGTMTVNSVDHTITCNGVPMGNDTQTDKMTMDVSFYVEQSRNNENFTCDKLLTNGSANPGD